MQVDRFFAHHGVVENPFSAEEARLDPVFERLADELPAHPDFPKIMGKIDTPSTAVVFGEKGTGKTAIRLLMGMAIDRHNRDHPDKPVLAVAYDDLNPVLDRLVQSRRQDVGQMLQGLRLADHQDAILSRAVSCVVDALLEDDAAGALPAGAKKKLRKAPKRRREDLLVLAALYDEPRTGSAPQRFARLRKALRGGTLATMDNIKVKAIVNTVLALLAAGWYWVVKGGDGPIWAFPLTGLLILGAVGAWGYWSWRWLSIWAKVRKATKDMPAVRREAAELRGMFGSLRPSAVSGQPLPEPSAAGAGLTDSRYQFTRKLTDLLAELGVAGMIVFIDRIDEPTAVQGDAERMKAVVWPMFDNKFLKQERIGLKLLLPIELGYALRKEGPAFFQEARLDKQNLVERLAWSGATLYDLCNLRLKACWTADAARNAKALEPRPVDEADPNLDGAAAASSGPAYAGASGGGGPATLADLFAPDVTRETLIDALDQMHQPRDAFKFLYAVIQEHCKTVPDDRPLVRVPRLTLETVRRTQSQRVQDLYRGLSPA
ncbi:MAG: hypothetical protein AAGA57_10790 [Planctomycetota bacterium]